MTTVNYTNAKAALVAAGLPTSAGSNWEGIDQASYDKFAAAATYKGGVAYSKYQTNYGFAYPSIMPVSVLDAVEIDDYHATLAGTPLTGAHASTPVTWTLTETGATGTSYSWHLGDGSSPQVTTVPHLTYTYSAAGTFTASVVPTVGGNQVPAISATAPAILS